MSNGYTTGSLLAEIFVIKVQSPSVFIFIFIFLQVFLLAGSQQCKQAANHLLIVIPNTSGSKYVINSSNNHD